MITAASKIPPCLQLSTYFEVLGLISLLDLFQNLLGIKKKEKKKKSFIFFFPNSTV